MYVAGTKLLLITGILLSSTRVLLMIRFSPKEKKMFENTHCSTVLKLVPYVEGVDRELSVKFGRFLSYQLKFQPISRLSVNVADLRSQPSVKKRVISQVTFKILTKSQPSAEPTGTL